jgi:hypothetical protein
VATIVVYDITKQWGSTLKLHTPSHVYRKQHSVPVSAEDAQDWPKRPSCICTTYRCCWKMSNLKVWLNSSVLNSKKINNSARLSTYNILNESDILILLLEPAYLIYEHTICSTRTIGFKMLALKLKNVTWIEGISGKWLYLLILISECWQHLDRSYQCPASGEVTVPSDPHSRVLVALGSK